MLSFVRTGPRDAPTVVLLHAVGYDLTYWDRQIEALYRDYHVVAVDLPGHGRSAGTAKTYARFDAPVAQVLEVIDAVDARPVHLVGISFGSMIAQELALRHPARVRSLVLIGSASGMPDGSRAAMDARAASLRTGGMKSVVESSLERWYTAQTRRERPDVVDRVTKTLLACDPFVQAAIWELVADLDTHERLATLRCPTLLVVGEEDTSTPVAASQRMATQLSDARIEVLPATAHLATVESPALVNAALLGFLATR